MRAEWLPILMQGTSSEVYVLDALSLRVVKVNQVARRNLQYSARELAQMTPLDYVSDVSLDGLNTLLDPLRQQNANRAALTTIHQRKDGTRYPIQLRFFYCASPHDPVFIAIGEDLSAQQACAKALELSETRYRAIISNTPGLFYQFLKNNDGSFSFPYLSTGCHALLGVSADKLRTDSCLFMNLIVAEDRATYLQSMEASATSMRVWNWEGRIWIEKWKDIKWINLRASPRALAGHGIQWDGIMTNITKSKLEKAEIKRSRAQLAELSAHVETVKENERTRLARELHDELGGNLTAIKMALALLVRRLPSAQPELTEKADYVKALVDRTIEAVHRISADLRPSILDIGIVAAIDWQAKEFEKQTGVSCRFTSDQKDIELHGDQSIALFRIFQEALTNIGKHAGAHHIDVKLTASKQNITLEIADDGCGIAPTDRIKPKSFGIRGMTERASALGGTLTVSNAVQGGTIVILKMPISA